MCYSILNRNSACFNLKMYACFITWVFGSARLVQIMKYNSLVSVTSSHDILTWRHLMNHESSHQVLHWGSHFPQKVVPLDNIFVLTGSS